MSLLKALFGIGRGRPASLPCPNCGGPVFETQGSPASKGVNTYRCRACGWSKLACGARCGSYLEAVRSNEYGEAWYKCVSCGWTGGGRVYRGECEGRARAKPSATAAKPQCFECGRTLQPLDAAGKISMIGDSIMKVLQLRCESCDLSFCPQCAGRKGFNCSCPQCGGETTPPLIVPPGF